MNEGNIRAVSTDEQLEPFGPLSSSDDAFELEKNRVSFFEIWDVISENMKDNPMTEEEVMELALEAQRWAREQMHKEGFFDDPRPSATDSKDA